MRTIQPESDVIDDLAIAEASAWLTRLQDSGCATDKAAFKEWLADKPAHARAFARVSDVWELIPGAMWPTRRLDVPAAKPRARAWRSPWLVAAACAAALLVAVGVTRVLLPASEVYQTAAGQQKTITLADATSVTLNTDTRMVVEYRRHERRVKLEHGEALFHVTENPRRPFVLETGGQQVVDLGTVFNVSYYGESVAVTLLEGKVWVGAAINAPGGQTNATVLEPGERLIVRAGGVPALDRPDVQDVTAWQHDRVYFNDTSLADAVAELDRYGGTPIRIADPALASQRISGVFSTHDPAQFAEAVASLHDLHVERQKGAIVLTR